MCETCEYISKEITLRKLTENQVYEAFDSLAGKSEIIDNGLIDKSSPKRLTEYICNGCGAKWHYAQPDHAYRGFIREVVS